MSKEEEELLGGAIHKEEELLGGAIRPDVKLRDAVSTKPDFRAVMQNAAVLESRTSPYLVNASALNMIPSNQLPFFQYMPAMEGQRELDTYNVLAGALSGHGAHRDTHKHVRAVIETLKHHPTILNMYLRAKA